MPTWWIVLFAFMILILLAFLIFFAVLLHRYRRLEHAETRDKVKRLVENLPWHVSALTAIIAISLAVQVRDSLFHVLFFGVLALVNVTSAVTAFIRQRPQFRLVQLFALMTCAAVFALLCRYLGAQMAIVTGVGALAVLVAQLVITWRKHSADPNSATLSERSNGASHKNSFEGRQDRR